MTSSDPAGALGQRVTAALAGFLADRADELAAISPALAPVGESIGRFVLDGGKRLRPAFAYWGWRGAGGRPQDDEPVVTAVAALELVHAGALIHDDVMDASATRRGEPAVHEHFAGRHRAEDLTGSPAGFGRATAILLGDLALVWADEMFAAADLPAEALDRARRAYDAMRTEVMAGQYLDVLAQAQPAVSADRALHVARFKSAKYTVERPLHIGALLHGGPPDLLARYSDYGLPVGEAFQLRDDLLGVFGDPSVTGKPAGDDLREGKKTVLVALALEHGRPADVELISRLLGDPRLDGPAVDRVREAIEASGARARVEAMIADRLERGLAALRSGDIEPDAASVLADLAAMATARHA